MLMVHTSHIGVGWVDGEPSVDSIIPTGPSAIDGQGVFVRLDDPIYKRGGKVFRATFLKVDFQYQGGGSGTHSQTETKDVMLCRAGMCNICDLSAPVMAAAPGNGGTPFVHSTCVKHISQAAHAFDAFQPRDGLKIDLPRAYPAKRAGSVVFDDGQPRNVFVCIPESCQFCKDIRVGRKPTVPKLTDGERRYGFHRSMKETRFG